MRYKKAVFDRLRPKGLQHCADGVSLFDTNYFGFVENPYLNEYKCFLCRPIDIVYHQLDLDLLDLISIVLVELRERISTERLF
ncbi:MAG: hypothetical protein DDT31_01815 [Syntrophomonadaceae bacterium]|nr:hypothetical protein [Bacillota bacterium]